MGTIRARTIAGQGFRPHRIEVVPATGFANGSAQVTFCTASPAPTKCTVERIYDQSGRGNRGGATFSL